jgi:hypothetical protein
VGRRLRGPPTAVPSAPVRVTSGAVLSPPFDRADALRVLELTPTADASAVKRAYRRLARTHHPDLGGDAGTFHELQRAYEVLLGADAGPAPVAPPGRPSRDREAWSSGHEGSGRPAPDADSIDWGPPPEGAVRLDRTVLARWLADATQPPVRPLTATSRAPGSRLNGAASRLSPDLTSQLTIGPSTDDRGRTVVAVVVDAGTRGGRRALEAVALDGGWVRRRGSASTRVRWTVRPDADPRVTAVRVGEALEAILDRAGWPLSDWTLTP